MTDDDKPAFKAKYAEMVSGLGADRAGGKAYWTALGRCELQDVLAAADWYLEHGSGNEQFPMPRAPQWVAKARELAMLRQREREQRTKDCRACDGTGWVLRPDAHGVSRAFPCRSCRGEIRQAPKPHLVKREFTSTADAMRDWQERREDA